MYQGDNAHQKNGKWKKLNTKEHLLFDSIYVEWDVNGIPFTRNACNWQEKKSMPLGVRQMAAGGREGQRLERSVSRGHLRALACLISWQGHRLYGCMFDLPKLIKMFP